MHPKNPTKTPKLMLLWCWTINWESGINVALLVAQLLFGSRLLILINFAQLHIDIPSLGWTSTLHTFIWLANMFTEYVHKGGTPFRLFLRIILFTGGGVGWGDNSIQFVFMVIAVWRVSGAKRQFNLQSWILIFKLLPRQDTGSVTLCNQK